MSKVSKVQKVSEITLLDDRVLIKPDAAKEKVGSLFIPDQSKEKPVRGLVVAVGSVPDRELEVKVGDYVLYGKYGGHGAELETDQGQCIILRETEIFAVFTDED